MAVVAMPALILAGGNSDTTQLAALVALLVGALTFVEYNSTYPSLVEFRDAAPFNRVRFAMLALMLVLLPLVFVPPQAQSAFASLVHDAGLAIGLGMDFPYSPVRLVTLVGGAVAGDAQIAQIRSAAGLAYVISLISLLFFVTLIRVGRWPRLAEGFNVWINLPTFDPTHGGDVVTRLKRDARYNIGLGLLLPFLTPAFVQLGLAGYGTLDLSSPQSLVWVVTLWAFLPASLIMRGIAMGQIADLIRHTRAVNRLARAERPLATA